MANITYTDELTTKISNIPLTINGSLTSTTYEVDSSGLNSIYIGEFTGRESGGIGQNIFIGSGSGQTVTIGNNNTSIGKNNIAQVSGTSGHTSIGTDTGSGSISAENVVFGNLSLSPISASGGTNNVTLGTNTGSATLNVNLSGNILIGHNTGTNNSNDNTLIISNNSSTSLIEANLATGATNLDGNVILGRSGGSDIINFNTSTSISATTGGGTLPSNPTAFLQIDINGTTFKIPYYNP